METIQPADVVLIIMAVISAIGLCAGCGNLVVWLDDRWTERKKRKREEWELQQRQEKALAQIAQLLENPPKHNNIEQLAGTLGMIEHKLECIDYKMGILSGPRDVPYAAYKYAEQQSQDTGGYKK